MKKVNRQTAKMPRKELFTELNYLSRNWIKMIKTLVNLEITASDFFVFMLLSSYWFSV